MDPGIFAGTIVVLLFSIIVHEVMHGLVALKFGDHTAKNAGRLTLNPIPHIDPLGSILVPLSLFLIGSPVMFGWAKPVPINPFNFRNIRKGELWVSAAGILANFGLAIAAAIIFHIANTFNIYFLMALTVFAVKINLVLALFNLLPIPPLDGSKIVISFLPIKTALSFQKLDRYGIFILILILLLPINILGVITGSFIRFFMAILGIPPYL